MEGDVGNDKPSQAAGEGWHLAARQIMVGRGSYAEPIMLDDMKRLIELFAARSPDRSTLDELSQTIDDRKAWHKAHGLFQRIRQKTLEADRRKDELASCQYVFEEVCAKALYNLSGAPAPFDADSPYWIVPNALSLARRMAIDESEVTKIVSG